MNNREKQIEKLMELTDNIFFYCIKRCNNKNDAEDLSQDIILDIIININKGTEIKNFDYYVWRICKNHYSKYIKKIKNNKVVVTDTVSLNDENIDILDTLIEKEKLEKINSAIKLLSSDYSEILYSYYIEDESLNSIANKMNLPLGTVKRRLFDIRNKLKEYLKMERLNGKKAFVPKNFSTCMSGGGAINPHQFTKSLINKNILFHSYDNPCTLEDYSLELGISIPYIKEIVDELEAATLLNKQGNRYLTNFPILTKEEDMQLTQATKDLSKTYGEELAVFAEKEFPMFKQIINNNHFTDNELMWVFMFYINMIVENYPVDKNEINEKALFRHKDSGGRWNFYMVENYETNSYGYSENWFGNKQFGFVGICFPGGYMTSEDKIFDTIAYKKCVSTCSEYDNFRIEYLEYTIKNLNKKYSEINNENKYKVDFMIKNNYLYLDNDTIKFNFVFLTSVQMEMLNSYFRYHTGLTKVREVKNEIKVKLRETLKKILPTYLEADIEYMISSNFCENVRGNVIKAFEEKNLIKPNETNKRFNFNMYAWEYK